MDGPERGHSVESADEKVLTMLAFPYDQRLEEAILLDVLRVLHHLAVVDRTMIREGRVFTD